MNEYSYYESGDGGGDASEAIPLENASDYDHAAVLACEHDYRMCDGWERVDCEFEITVIGPEGEVKYSCCHEPDIYHRTTRLK